MIRAIRDNFLPFIWLFALILCSEIIDKTKPASGNITEKIMDRIESIGILFSEVGSFCFSESWLSDGSFDVSTTSCDFQGSWFGSMIFIIEFWFIKGFDRFVSCVSFTF